MKSIAKLSVRGKLIFTALSGTIFVFAFLLLNNLYLNYNVKLNEKEEILQNLKKEVILLQNEENAYLTELVNNNDILFLNIDNHLVKIEKRYQTASRLIDSVRLFNIYASDTIWLETLDNVDAYLDELYHQYEDLILNYKERGTVHHNLIKQWTNAGEELESLMFESNQIPLIAEITTLRKNEKNYLIYADIETLDIIINTIENIKALINYEYPEYSYKTIELCDRYLMLAKQIGAINERIGIGANEGLRQQLTSLANILDSHLYDLSEYQQEQIQQYKNRAYNGMLIAYGVLILLYFLLLFYIGNSINKPLYRVNEYLERLTKGELPEKIDWNIKGELGILINRLNHFIFTLKEKKDFAIKLSNGNLEESIDLKSRKDILGKTLISLQNNLKYANEEHEKHLQENKLRQYINEGINNISEVFQLHSNDLGHLADEFIIRLVKYLDIVQGALFLMNREKKETILELKGAFAYDRKKYLEKEIKLGQGLVGTCALEKKPIKPRHLPDDYINITSGLGDSPPSHLFLVPVMNDDVVEGVIELAGLKEFEDHQLELIKTIANNLGSALGSIRVNAQTAELLKKSQQQATEMSEQEEEMRQNMEELQATQEEAARREEETKNIMSAYHKAVLYMEYDLDGKIEEVNDNYIRLFNRDKSKIVGKFHSNIYNIDHESEIEKKLWADLRMGEQQTRIEAYVNDNGEKKWLYQQYTPVLNASNETYKVVNIAYDITEQKNKESEIHAREQEIKSEKREFEVLKYIFEQTIAKAEFSVEGQIVEHNRNFEKLIGLEAEDLKDKLYNEYLNKVEIEKFDGIWEHILQSKRSISSLLRRTKPSGENIWISATFSPVFHESKDQIDKIIMLGSDITENIQRITR
ncbi:MAG: PAS domain-containing protein [Bacteroidetes bacterium]|jgi:PAS domain S-box-containing protein|nr:PAS domain-containing protein [Bacteroidota bacterium]